MQTFSKKKIALAVGSSLLALAGTANAAAPALRAVNPSIISNISTPTSAEIRNLLSTGVSQEISITVSLTSITPPDLAVPGLGGDILAVNPTLSVTGATLADRNVYAYTGAQDVANALPIVTSQLNTDATGASDTATVTLTLATPPVGALYRVASGVLQYAADGTTFLPVTLVVQSTAANTIYTEDPVTPVAGFDAATGDLALVAATDASVNNSLAPTPTMATKGSAAGLVDGFTIDTATPITIAPANLSVRTRDTVQPITVTTATVGNITTVSLPALGVVATAADFVLPIGTPNAADAAYYNSTNFNTGVQFGTVPFLVDGSATAATYTEVFDVETGAPATLAASGTPLTGLVSARFSGLQDLADAANPVIVSTAASNPNEDNPIGTTLELTFSEPIQGIFGNNNDLREITENVFLNGAFTSNNAPAGTASLAAIALNDELNLSHFISATDGQGVLSIQGINGGQLTSSSQVTVRTGISYKESNDDGFDPLVPEFDDGNAGEANINLGGGIRTQSGTVEAASISASPVTPAIITLDFDDATARAQTIASDPSKVGQVTVKFAAPVALATGTSLNGQIRVTVSNTQFANPRTFQFFPTNFSFVGGNLVIALPTDLIYENIGGFDDMRVNYLNEPTVVDGALVKATASATPLVDLLDSDRVDGGEIIVDLPLSANQGASKGIITQSIVGSFTNLTNGDRVTAHIAHWETNPSAFNFDAIIDGGTITSPTSTTLELDSPNDLEVLINAQINAAQAAQAAVPGVSQAQAAVRVENIPVYFVVEDGVATLYNSLVDARNRSDDIIRDISDALSSAGFEGAEATGADGSNLSSGSTNTTAQAALAAGNAATVAELLDKAGNNNIPQSVILAATNAAAAPGATPASVIRAVYALTSTFAPRTASLNPTTGAITGAVTGRLVIENDNEGTDARGLVIDFVNNADAIIGSVNGSGNSFNLLVGVDPTETNLAGLRAETPRFVLITHQSAETGEYTLLTSADPTAANFVPFTPNLLATGAAAGQRTTLPTVDLNNYAKANAPQAGAWSLIPIGNPAVKTGALPVGHTPLFERAFVGLQDGFPVSTWTNDFDGGDIAFGMVGSRASAATELGGNDITLTSSPSATFFATNTVRGAGAFAWKNDSGNGAQLSILQAGPVAGTLPVGWSLVTVPASGVFSNRVNAIIKVGDQTNAPYTWIEGDTVAPALTAGEPVFVFSRLGGPL